MAGGLQGKKVMASPPAIPQFPVQHDVISIWIFLFWINTVCD